MSSASRADLLAPKPRQIGTETLPVSGLTVSFRSLRESEYAAFEMQRLKRDEDGRMVSDEEPIKTIRARLIALCLCDEAGEPIFSAADVDGISDAFDLADSMFLVVKLQEHCGLAGNYSQIAAARAASKKNLPETNAAASP